MKTVFFDVDTQIDFLFPAGALYVPGVERIVPNVARLNRFAESQGSVVVSTMDAHAENEREFVFWPAHCVAHTKGQEKPRVTLLERRVVIPNEPLAYRVDLGGYQQILVEKQTLDCFETDTLARLLDRIGAEQYVVYGVVTEICVRFAAMGLLARGKPVELVTDAVMHLSAAKSEQILGEFVRRGGLATSTARVCQQY